MNKPIRTAILGQGRSGRDIHGRYLKQDKRFQVAAIIDQLPGRREIAQKEWDCPVYSRYEDLFGQTDIDLVINASFSCQHAAISSDLLVHGYHVVSEKPGAIKAEDIRRMAAISRDQGRLLAFFQQSRFAPYYQQIKSVLASGKLGRIVQISIRFNGFARRWDWQCCQDMGGGSLYNTGPHPLDQALDLLDFNTEDLNLVCQMDKANSFGDAEDYVKIILHGPGRPLVDIEISSCDAYPGALYQVQGTRGGLQGNMTEIKWRYFLETEAPPQKLLTEPLADAQGLPMYCGEELSWYDESWSTREARVFSDAVARFYDHVYAALTAGQAMPITPQQVEKQIDLMERCHQQQRGK